MKRKLVAVKLTRAHEAQIEALQEMGFGNQSDVIRTALDRMYREEIGKMGKVKISALINDFNQAHYDLSHAPFTDELLKAEERIRKTFIELARLRANQINSGWIDVVSGKRFEDRPEHYQRYRYAEIDESGAENFLKNNKYLNRLYREEEKMGKETLKSVLLDLGATPITYVGSMYGDDGTPSDDPGRTLPAAEWLENIAYMGFDTDIPFIEHPSNVWTDQDGFYMESGNICFHGSDHSTECVFEL